MVTTRAQAKASTRRRVTKQQPPVTSAPARPAGARKKASIAGRKVSKPKRKPPAEPAHLHRTRGCMKGAPAGSYPQNWSLHGGGPAGVQLVTLRHSGAEERALGGAAARREDTSEADAVLQRWNKGMASLAGTPYQLATGAAFRPSVKAIERIENLPLWSAFKKACSPMLEVSGTQEVLAWHGTSKEAAWRIAHEGFREGQHGLWAAHCSATSWGYCQFKTQTGFAMPPGHAQVQLPAPSAGWRDHVWKGDYVMLLCRVLLVNLPHPNPAWRTSYDGPPWGPGAARMLHSSAVAHPEYLVHFSVS